MGARRTINGDSERAYRVVQGFSWGPHYMGPYSTLGAAKGVRTREQKYYPNIEIWIEQTPEGWEKVESK